jgi:hypothetical protein
MRSPFSSYTLEQRVFQRQRRAKSALLRSSWPVNVRCGWIHGLPPSDRPIRPRSLPIPRPAPARRDLQALATRAGGALAIERLESPLAATRDISCHFRRMNFDPPCEEEVQRPSNLQDGDTGCAVSGTAAESWDAAGDADLDFGGFGERESAGRAVVGTESAVMRRSTDPPFLFPWPATTPGLRPATVTCSTVTPRADPLDARGARDFARLRRYGRRHRAC